MAQIDTTATVRRNGKSAAAFRTISEVADDLEVPPHVLRFWETKFTQVRPLKRGGGRRYYRPEDVALLQRIRELLYREGYTIKGVQKLLRDGAVRMPTAGETARAAHATNPVKGGRPPAVNGNGVDADVKDAIGSALDDLRALRHLLAAARR
ncbi:MAG: MerR family transcriptional regulator [Alphaproteobacteria bacterium]|nr:MerR family transcriptional regulator [Alphaproteobacteria bacterium]